MLLDLNQPIENPELVRAMNLFLLDQRMENAKKLSAQVNKGVFLVPIVLPDGAQELKPGDKLEQVEITYQLITHKATGSDYLMAFTDREELHRWSSEKVPALVCFFDDLKHAVLTSKGQCKGFVINPVSQGITITAEEMELPPLPEKE